MRPGSALTALWRASPRLSLKLGLTAAITTAAVILGTADITIRYFHQQVLNLAAEASSTESDALRIVLEEQMISGNRELLERLVHGLGEEPGIDWVGLLNPKGVVMLSSDPSAVGHQFDRASPDCQVCHGHRATERVRSVTLVRPEGDVLRTVTPLMNRPACQECHPKRERVNGMLIVDRSLAPVDAAVRASRAQGLIAALGASLAVIAILGLAVERLVLVRVRRLRRAARDLGRGHLTVRALEETSDDELADLTRDFNAMADRLGEAMAGVAAERRQLEELVNGIADGVVLVDRDLRVLITNRAFLRRLGEGCPPIAGLSHAEIMGGAGLEDHAGQGSPAERALKSGRLEKQVLRTGDGERIEEIYAEPLHAPDGSIAGVIEVWRDITDRVALEAGLEQSERLAALGILASGVAHEVGNPLASIATAVEGLLRRLDRPDPADIAEAREYLEIVKKQVFRCRNVTQRLLGFARVPRAEPATVDVSAAAREVLALVAHQAKSQSVEIRPLIGEGVLARVEEMLIEQVLLNLVLNGLQAMPRGGKLTVGVRAEDGHVLVAVEDTGPGIPPAVRAHLFEPFRTARENQVGTGLGLFLTQTLLRRSGGTIEVESELGKGAAFTVRLAGAAEDTRAAS